MAEEPQTPPSLEEFRAAQAAQAKKVTPPSLEEFRAAQAAQNGQQPPFAQAPSQQQPPQGGSVGAPAGASPSTSAAGGGGAIAAPPAPKYSLPTEEELQAAPRPTIDQLRKEGLELQARSIEQQRERSKVELASRFADLDLAGVKKVRGDIEQRKEQIADLRTRMEAQRKAIEDAAPTSPEGADMALSEINSYNARISALDDLAYSVQRDEELANQREFNLKAKQGTIPGWLHNEFMQGIGSMAAGTEGFMIEAMARGLPSSLLPASEEEKATMTRDQLAKKWKREILPAMREMPEKAWGSETTPEYMQAARGTWLGSAAGGVTQSIPMMLTPAMSGFFVSGVDGYMRELEGPEFDDIPEAEKLAVAVPGGYVANILERYGFRNLVGNKSALYEVTRAVLGRVPENATIEQAMKVINAETPSAAKNYLSRSVGGFMSEAETGGMQEIADVSIRNLYNTIKGKKVLEEPASWYEFASDVTRSAIEEGVGGKIMAQVPAVSAAMRTSSLGENTDDRHFELVERLLRDKSYEESMARHIDSRVESGDISLEDAERMKADWKAAQNISSRIPEDLSTSRRRRVFDILTEKEKLSRMEPVLVREKIEQLDTKLAKAAGVSAVEEEKGRAAQPTTAVPDTPAPTMKREGAAVQPRQVAPTPKQVFGEKPDKDADVPVWSSLSKGSVLTDSSQPNSHWVVVDDQKSKRSGERIMTLAIVERESDGTWLAGPPSIIVAIGSDGSLRTDTSPRYSYTDADGNRGTAIMQPSSASIPFGEVIQEDGTTGERFTPQWAKDMPKPKTTPPPQGTIVAGDGRGAGSTTAATAAAGQRQVVADIATPVIPVPTPPTAGIAPEAIAEIDDVLGITTAAPAAQPEGPVRPEGTGAIPVSERRSKTEPGGKRHMVYVENVRKALSEVAPGIKVFVHATPDAYRAAIEGYNAKHGTNADPSQSTAIYLPASEEVHLSPSADGQSLAHEAAHPIVSALITHRPEVFERLYDEIAADPAMAKMLEFGKLYSDQDAIVQKAESIVRLMDAVASGEIKVSIDPKSAWQRFKRWLQDLLASIGLDTRSIDLSDPKNVREFAASFSDAIANGIKIKKVGWQAQAKSAAPDLQKDAERIVDGWYSRLDDAVVAKGSTMPASQWKTWLEARAKEGALSLEEAKWTGLNDFLASKGNEKVTPQQVREFLKENRVTVEVKEIGGGIKPMYVVLDADGYDISGEALTLAEARELSEQHDGSTIEDAPIDTDYLESRFSQYQLHGGTNYREIAITLPGPEKYRVPSAHSMGEDADVNRLLHLRLNDRVVDVPFTAEEEAAIDERNRLDAERKKLDASIITAKRKLDEARKPEEKRIHEEVMEDVKAGRMRLGDAKQAILDRLLDLSDSDSKELRDYRKLLAERDAITKRMPEAPKRRQEKILFIEELQSDWGQEGKKKGFGPPPSDKETAAALMSGRALDRKTPPAPFVSSTDAWVELGLKQAIRMAVEGGYDKVAWSTGEQQFNRWGSQAFAWSKGKTGWRVVGKEQIGGEAFAGMEEALAQEAKESDTIVTSKEELRDVVEGVMGRERSDYSPENWKTHINKMVDGMWERMQSEDSGTTMPRREGMKGFYDKILPTVAKKVSKRLGGDGAVGDVVIGKDQQIGNQVGRQQSVSITPDMRAKVMSGVPLMQRRDPAEVAAVFAKHGMTPEAAAAYMQQKGIDPGFAQQVVDAMQQPASAQQPSSAQQSTQTKKAPSAARQLVNDLLSAGLPVSMSDAEYRKDFARLVKEALDAGKLRGKIGTQQVRALVTRAAKTDPRNDGQVERFILYADRVVANANYADAVKKAKQAKKKALKLSRRKNMPVNHANVLENIAQVDVEMLDDPDAFVSAVSEYMKAFASVTSDKYAPFSSRKMDEYVGGILQEQKAQTQAMYQQALMAQGVDAEAADAMEIMQAIMADEFDAYEDNLTEAKKRDLNDRLNRMADIRRSALMFADADPDSDLADLLDKHRAILNRLKSAHPEAMTAKQKAEYIRVVDNVLFSGSFSGSAFAAAVAESSSTIGKAVVEARRFDARRLFSPSVGSSVLSLPQAIRSVFGSAGPGAKIQSLMGLTAFNAAKKSWSDEMKALDKEYATFYQKLLKKYKNSHGDAARSAEGMVAFAIQSMPSLDPDASFERNKIIIQEDIARRADTRKLQREAPVLQSVYDKVLAPARSREEAMALLRQNYPSAFDAVSFTIDLGKRYAEVLKRHDEDVWNERGDWNDPYYVHKAFTQAPGTTAKLDPDEPRNVRFHESLKPSQSGGLKARVSYNSLPPDRLINYDMRRTTLWNLSKSLYDYHTAEAQMRVSEFMKMPEARIVFGSGENKSFIQEAIGRYVRSEYMDYGSDRISVILNRVTNGVRSVAVGRALGGFLQLPKQFVEAFLSASVMLNGRVDLVTKNILNISEADELLNTFSIGDRSGVQGGTKWEGRLRQNLTNLEGAITGNVADKLAGSAEFIKDVWMRPLSVGDAASAKAAWLAAYEQYRMSQGHRVESWKQEGKEVLSDESRMEAAQYAEDIVDYLFTPSDPAKASSLAKRGSSGYENMAKAMFLPLASYAINAASRTAMDVGDIYGWAVRPASASNPFPAAARNSLIAKGIGTAAFLGISSFMVPMVQALVGQIMEMPFDDDDEGDENFAYVAAVMHGLYLLGLMDADLYRSSSKRFYERTERRRQGKSAEEFYQGVAPDLGAKRMKVFQTRMLLDLTSIGVQQQIGDGFVMMMNRIEYESLVRAEDPSVLTKSGGIMSFDVWRSDSNNPTFYTYGQGFSKDNGAGLFGMVLSMRSELTRKIEAMEKLNSDEAVERNDQRRRRLIKKYGKQPEQQ